MNNNDKVPISLEGSIERTMIDESLQLNSWGIQGYGHISKCKMKRKTCEIQYTERVIAPSPYVKLAPAPPAKRTKALVTLPFDVTPGAIGAGARALPMMI